MPWIEGDVDVHEGTIHWYRRGDGPPVVLAHGMTDNGRCWTRVAERLEDRYELIAYDARGHGRSSDIPASPPSAGEDLLALVDALELGKPAAMGHSMGAGAVADAASRAPDALRAAILEDPAWRSTPMPGAERSATDDRASKDEGRERARALTGWFDDLRTMSLDEAIEAGRRHEPPWHPDEIPPWAESKLQFRPAPPRPAGEGAGDHPRRPDWRQQARAIRIPTLLVSGDPSRALVDLEAADEAARLCPTLEVVRFATGHNVRREDFDGFVAAVTAFLARVHDR